MKPKFSVDDCIATQLPMTDDTNNTAYLCDAMNYWFSVASKSDEDFEKQFKCQFIVPKCECGSAICQSDRHSDWCPAYTKDAT